MVKRKYPESYKISKKIRVADQRIPARASRKEELGYLAHPYERLRSAIVQTNVNNHEEEKIESISTTNGTFLQLPVAVLPAAALLVGMETGGHLIVTTLSLIFTSWR